MHRIVIWLATAIGATVGVFSAVMSGVGVMVVMGIIGAAFGCSLGGGLCVLLMAFKKKRLVQSHDFEKEHFDERFDVDPYAQMKLVKQWIDERENFPFHIAGDTDPVAKSMTGWKDASDVARNRDLLS